MAEESAPAGGQAGQPETDHNMLADLWRDHKTPIMVIIAGATLAVTIYAVMRNQASSNAAAQTTGAAGTPTALTTDSATGLASLTSYMQAILQQLQNGSNGSSSSSTPKSPGSLSSPGNAPAQKAPGSSSARYVTVSRWTPNPAWSATLWGIAQHEGISLTRIEALNPQIANPNLIYAGEKVRVA